MTNGDNRLSSVVWLNRITACTVTIMAPAIYLRLANMLQAQGKFLNHSGGYVELMFYGLLLYSLTSPLIAGIVEKAQIDKYHNKGKPKTTAAKMLFDISVVKITLAGAVYFYGAVVLFVSGDWWRLIPFYVIAVLWSVIHWPRRKEMKRTLERLETL
ncbi:MAG: hypothetical protein KAW46_02500 [candidate division Zixibacteria bacterium]|nr:hypothetical protein [candidate division Zixibacteria bacterium]